MPHRESRGRGHHHCQEATRTATGSLEHGYNQKTRRSGFPSIPRAPPPASPILQAEDATLVWSWDAAGATDSGEPPHADYPPEAGGLAALLTASEGVAGQPPVPPFAPVVAPEPVTAAAAMDAAGPRAAATEAPGEAHAAVPKDATQDAHA